MPPGRDGGLGILPSLARRLLESSPFLFTFFQTYVYLSLHCLLGPRPKWVSPISHPRSPLPISRSDPWRFGFSVISESSSPSFPRADSLHSRLPLSVYFSIETLTLRCIYFFCLFFSFTKLICWARHCLSLICKVLLMPGTASVTRGLNMLHE